MPVPDFSGLPPFADFNDVTIKINDLVQRLRQLLLTLDTLNIRSLHAKVIEAGTITGDKIQANTITADKIEVNELSAISANLGHITAGLIESIEIFGSFISTNRYGYPKVELSNTEDMIGAYKSSDNAIQIYSPSDEFSPIIKFITPMGVAYIFYDIEDNAIAISSNDANIHINTTEEINIMGQKGVWINGQQVAPPI
jgi:hypothetical protein